MNKATKNTMNASLSPLDYTSEVTLHNVKITPKIAESLLEFNTSNRRKNQGFITRYAADMEHGRWKLNGACIAFTKNTGKTGAGRLQDGQKRLTACIIAKTPFHTNVIFGLEPDAFDTHDSGEIRRMSHVYDVIGKKNTTTLASAAKMVNDYFDGTVLARRGYPNNEAIDLLKRYPGLEDSVMPGKALSRVTIPSVAAAMHYLFSKVDAVKTGHMFELMKHGIGLDLGSPVHTLREALMQSASIGEKKLKPYAVAALFIKAFNTIQAGKKIRSITWIGSGEKAEQFPEINGLPPKRAAQVVPLSKAA